MVDGEVEIAPPGAREAGADLIIQPNLGVSFERGFHRRPQHSVALFVGHPAARDDPYDIVGQLLDDFDHEVPLFQTLILLVRCPPAEPAGIESRILPRG